MPTVVCTLLLALNTIIPAFTFRGTVTDASGAAIVGARVGVIRDDGVSQAGTVTDQQGAFTLSLEAGRYVLVIAADGFREMAVNVIAGSAGGETRKVVLEIAGVSEAVSVRGATEGIAAVTSSATKTPTALRDVPQSVTVVPQAQMKDQLMTSIGDVIRYVPGISSHQGENNRDQLVIRGNSTSADFFVNGVRDDVQYYRDVYNLERIEAIKGPNAMIFGRGGAGGVINRVTKEAGFQPLRDFSVQAGSFGNTRVTADIDQPVNDNVAFRLNGMFENSDSFRSNVDMDRFGITPTLTIIPGTQTKIALRYEYLHDRRVADRGMPSFRGLPVDADISTYFGDPSASHVDADVHLTSATVEHHFNRVAVRNNTMVGFYDRGYQNFVPGAVSANQAQVTLTAYNNATQRTNVFNQTDITSTATTGSMRHTLLAGVELGRQLTDNFRNTGYFNNTATSILVPYNSPTIATPVTFRQSATDADNHLVVNVAAAYAQDQVAVSRFVQVIGGIRFDRFDLQYHNNRNEDELDRVDGLVSPRAGVVVKPIEPVSIYSSYSVSYLPSSGDQFSSLTTITQQVKPERFNNYEVGVKADVRSNVSLTGAVYRLDRTNTRSTDPNDPTRIVQTGSQRTNGVEVGINGHILSAWSVAGGYAWQDAFVTSATTAAASGATVAQVPHHTVSLWNTVRVHPRISGGLGVIYRSDMFAAIDDTVRLPGYVRADAAGYVTITRNVRVQANFENLFDRRYFVNADSNTNISPGSPRAFRVALTTSF